MLRNGPSTSTARSREGHSGEVTLHQMPCHLSFHLLHCREPDTNRAYRSAEIHHVHRLYPPVIVYLILI